MKKFLSVVFVLMMAVSLVFAGGSEESDSSLKKVTISLQPAHHSLGAFVALEKGWFEEEGLDVDVLVYTSGSPQLEAVASDAWSVGVMGVAAGVTGLLSYDLTCVGFSQWDIFYQNLYARPDSDIAQAGPGHIEGYPDIYGTPEMYEGKTIFCRKGSMEYLQLLATLDALGLSESDVNIVNMEVASAYQAFLAGEGDLICLLTTWAADAEERGLVKVSSMQAADLFVPSTILVSPAALEDAETTQKILNVMIRGFMWVLNNKEEAAEYYCKVCEDEGMSCTMEYANAYIGEAYGPSIEDYKEMLASGQFSADLEKVMNYYVKAGVYTPEDVPIVAAGFDGTMLEKAIEHYEANYMGQE